MRAAPRYLSPIPEGTDIEYAHVGARLQRLPTTPQGELVAGVMEAKDDEGLPIYSQITVQIPRRSTKTTTIQNVLLGRCASIPGYVVVSTAQDGTRASEFLSDLMDQIENHVNDICEQRNDELEAAWDGEGNGPEEFTFKDGLAELGIRQLYRSQGREFIKWRNGSKWKAVPPEAPKLRGKGVRVIWVDEGGEMDPETSPTLLAGALPMLDTNPDGQIIISGTPGRVRAGAFWEALEKARSAPERFGIVDYSGDDFVDPHNEDNWWLIHPGLACGLTSIKVLRERHEGMAIDLFMMEYLCVWPPDSKVTALNLKNWDTTKFDALEQPPADYVWGIGYDVAPDGTEACVSVAWLDAAGDPWVQVMRHRAGGSAWLEDYLARALATFPKVPIGYDSIGENIAVAQQLARRPRFRKAQLKSLNLKDVGAATAMLAQANERLALRHAEHPALDTSVRNAGWRQAGDTRLFSRKAGQITPLMSGIHALAVVVAAPQKRAGSGLPKAVVH